MTKKHFKAIAEIISKQPATQEVFKIAMELAIYFQLDNPRFDRQKLLNACFAKNNQK